MRFISAPFEAELIFWDYSNFQARSSKHRMLAADVFFVILTFTKLEEFVDYAWGHGFVAPSSTDESWFCLAEATTTVRSHLIKSIMFILRTPIFSKQLLGVDLTNLWVRGTRNLPLCAC